MSELTWQQWLENHQVLDTIIKISDEQASQIWKPTEEDSEAAWILYTEIRSRITTQPLHYRSGDEETALDSLYQLFALTRNTIEDKGPKCRHFATLAMQLLNTHVRPLTAKWHKKKIAGRIQHDDDRREFRKELSQLQPVLILFCQLFGKIAAGNDYCDNPEVPINRDTEYTNQMQDIPFAHILLDENIVESENLFKAELNAISDRRGGDDKVSNLVGLACSGGGIRSATFCQGIAQSLYKKGLLKDIDYISTVSGGGYFGSFLSSYLNDDPEKVSLAAGKLPFAEKNQAEPKPLRQLRNNSKYLLKDGILGKSRIAGLLLFGMLVNLLTLLPVLLSAVAINKISQEIEITAQIMKDHTGFILTGVLIALSGMIIGLPLIYKYRASKLECIAGYEKMTLITALTTVVIWFLSHIWPVFNQSMLAFFGTELMMLTFFACLPFVLVAIALALGLSTLMGRLFMTLAGITGPLLLLTSYLALNAFIPAGTENIFILLASILVITLWLSIINVNQISPHRYYRNRLAETYLLQAGNDSAADPQLLSQLQSNNPAIPYHLINAAVNLPNSKNPDLRGRNSDFFLFSRYYCGSPLLGYSQTAALEKVDPHLNLGTAMAVSGAAASAFMGTATIKGLSFWLSLLNIRLGYWLPNPKHLPKSQYRIGTHPFSLWKELFGKIDEDDKFVNLSDGGHIENLGIYELLRRKCKFIIAIDGEADPAMAFPSLMNVIRYAQIDFGIKIKIDLDDLRPGETGFSKAHFAMGEIVYGNNQTGYLLYIKSSLTGNEPDYMLDYQKQNTSFPHETTADQFFSEAQFEAYRSLGEHIGSDLFHDEFVKPEELDNTGSIGLECWFKALVRNLQG